MSAIFKKAAIALTLALLLVLPLAGSASAKWIDTDESDADMETIIGALDGIRGGSEEGEATRGWYVSQFNKQYKLFKEDPESEGLEIAGILGGASYAEFNHGEWVATFVHWLKGVVPGEEASASTAGAGDEEEGGKKEKTNQGQANREAGALNKGQANKALKVQVEVEDDEDDDEDDEDDDDDEEEDDEDEEDED